MPGSPLRERPAGRSDESLEPPEVDRFRCHREAVTRPVRLDERSADGPAQAVDIHLKRLGGGTRRRLSPQLVDQPLPRQRLTGCEQQRGEQRPLLRSPERDRPAVENRLERAQNAEFDAHKDPLDAFRAEFKAPDC
jgi:hypothetical protein